MMTSNSNTTIEKTTVLSKILKSIKKIGRPEEFIEAGQTLYHGTNQSAQNAIRRQGFDINKCKRGEVGQGVYLGLDKQRIAKIYGNSVVEAKFTGDKVAQLEPGVYDILQGTFSPVKFDLAEALNIDIASDEGQKLLNTFINKYYTKTLDKKGIQGFFVQGSYNADCNYFAVLDPKHLQIL